MAPDAVQRSTVPLLLAAMPPTLSGVVPVSQAIVQSVTAMSPEGAVVGAGHPCEAVVGFIDRTAVVGDVERAAAEVERRHFGAFGHGSEEPEVVALVGQRTDFPSFDGLPVAVEDAREGVGRGADRFEVGAGCRRVGEFVVTSGRFGVGGRYVAQVAVTVDDEGVTLRAGSRCEVAVGALRLAVREDFGIVRQGPDRDVEQSDVFGFGEDLLRREVAGGFGAVVDLGDRRAVVVGEYDHVFHRAHDGVPCEPDGAALVFGQRQYGRCEYAALVHPERTYDARRVFRPERNFGAALPLGRIAGAYQLYGLFAASVVGAYDRTPAVVRGRGLPRVVGIERQGRFAACDSYGKAFALETVDFDVGFAGLLGDGEFLAERTFAIVADDDQPRRFGRGKVVVAFGRNGDLDIAESLRRRDFEPLPAAVVFDVRFPPDVGGDRDPCAFGLAVERQALVVDADGGPGGFAAVYVGVRTCARNEQRSEHRT